MEPLQLDLDGQDPRRGLGTMARGLIGSEILKIAGEIRVAMTAGQKIANYTVGDFAPAQFPIPDKLREATLAALSRGETNYPPSDGVPVISMPFTRLYPGLNGAPDMIRVIPESSQPSVT